MSQRRLVATLAGIGKLKQHKKSGIYWLELGFAKLNKPAYVLGGYYSLRQIPTPSLEMAIKDWLTPAYEAAIVGDRDPYTHKMLEEEHVRIALDLCYKELARRAEKL